MANVSISGEGRVGEQRRQEVMEEVVGHTMEALVGHVEVFGLYSDQDETSQRTSMIFRRRRST